MPRQISHSCIVVKVLVPSPFTARRSHNLRPQLKYTDAINKIKEDLQNVAKWLKINQLKLDMS